MKKFINDYWWLFAIAVFLWWRKNKGEKKDNPTEPKTEPDTKTCPNCGSKMKRYSTDKGDAGVDTGWLCKNDLCHHRIADSRDGQYAGKCRYCGSDMTYHYGGSPSDGHSLVNFPRCNNPDCSSRFLCY